MGCGMIERKSHKSVVISLLLILAIMICLTAASVPLFRLFCQATGYGGTVKIYTKASETIGTKKIKIHFNADIDPNLKWKFQPEQLSLDLITGENKLAFYSAENLTNEEIVGMAIYNVTPQLAGKYFNKVECFCFNRQLMKPHEKVLMPVLFFIDPAIEQDPNVKDIHEVTLSYSFFKLDE